MEVKSHWGQKIPNLFKNHGKGMFYLSVEEGEVF